jgi:hypothetical protein
MSDAIIEQFIDKLTRFYGRAFTIVTGQDSYSFGKENHANMLNHEGVYLLLENVPLTDMRRKYDKATLITADSVNRMIPTNDPNLVKKGFSLSGSKLRIEMYKQCVKLFQATPILVREIVFAKPRKVFRLDRNDWLWLTKNNGEIIFICTIRYGSTKRLVDVIRIAANNVTFENGQISKAIPIDLDGIVLKRINDMGFTITSQYGVLTNEQYNERKADETFQMYAGRAGMQFDSSPGDHAEIETEFRLPEKQTVATEHIKEIFKPLEHGTVSGNKNKEDTVTPAIVGGCVISEGQQFTFILPGKDYEIEVQGTITSVKRRDNNG